MSECIRGYALTETPLLMLIVGGVCANLYLSLAKPTQPRPQTEDYFYPIYHYQKPLQKPIQKPLQKPIQKSLQKPIQIIPLDTVENEINQENKFASSPTVNPSLRIDPRIDPNQVTLPKAEGLAKTDSLQNSIIHQSDKYGNNIIPDPLQTRANEKQEIVFLTGLFPDFTQLWSGSPSDVPPKKEDDDRIAPCDCGV